jgi:hypothetical protein
MRALEAAARRWKCCAAVTTERPGLAGHAVGLDLDACHERSPREAVLAVTAVTSLLVFMTSCAARAVALSHVVAGAFTRERAASSALGPHSDRFAHESLVALHTSV